MDEREFQHRDVLRVFPDIKPRSVIHWSEIGLMSSLLQDASGLGTKRLYSFRNLVEIAILRELSVNQLPTRLMRMVMRASRVQEALDQQRWDSIILIKQDVIRIEETGRAPWTAGIKVVAIDAFGLGELDFTSCTVINVKRLVEFVKRALL